MARTSTAPHFTPELFRFLRDLERNNRRDWFEANKNRYLEHARDPMLRFIADFGPRLGKISPRLVADPRPVGGSMFRIYRDTRFSKDKRPYKTACTARFPHEAGKNVHVPGFYLHLGADGVYGGAGIWRPDAPTLAAVRAAIVNDPKGWTRAQSSKGFRAGLEVGGESLKRPPRGIDPEHPLIEDLKRKDHVVFGTMSEKEACAADFLDGFTGFCRTAAPYVRFLTRACGLEF